MILVVAATERELVLVDGAALLCCGIGPVEAGIATANALARERPDALLHVGIAGAAELEAGSVVIGSEAFYCDISDAASLSSSSRSVRPCPFNVGSCRVQSLTEGSIGAAGPSKMIGSRV